MRIDKSPALAGPNAVVCTARETWRVICSLGGRRRVHLCTVPKDEVKRRIRAFDTLNGFWFIVLALALAATVSDRPAAQSSLQITSPLAGTRFAAGPDYATDVLGDPWDMSNAEDLGLDPAETIGWASDFQCCNGGVAGGTTAPIGASTVDTSLSLLYRGRTDTINTGRTGLRYPIDSAKYQKLSFRISTGVGDDNVQVYWFHHPWLDPQGLGMGVGFIGYTVSGAKVFVTDLAQILNSSEPWTSGVVRGLRIDPNNVNVGHTVFFDWVRLTAPDGPGAAMMTVIWQGGSGSSTIEVTDTSGTVLTVASAVSGTSYTWNYGILPPGSYSLKVRSGAMEATTSFSVNDPPILHLSDPDETGGEDFATTVLVNPWDMNDASDVIYTEGVTNLSFSGGQLHGTNTTPDPAITFLGIGNNQVPIDSVRYRYLTFRLQIDGPYDLFGGSVARAFWGSQQFQNASTMTTSDDIVMWEGMNSYTIDLAQLTPGGGIEPGGTQQLWTTASIQHFRIDPHEFSTVRSFQFDDVKLAAIDEANGSFVITWAGSDANPQDSPVVALYYDTDTDPSAGLTPIVSGVNLGDGQYTWNTAGVVPGEYYVYAAVSDGIDTRGFYSTGKLRVNSPAVASEPIGNVDAPASGSSILQTFTVAGWAIDRAATGGTGVDQVNVYANPTSAGSSSIFLGAAAYGQTRADIGGAFGSQFTNSGYQLTVSSSGFGPGSYQIVAYAHSTVTGTSTTYPVNVVVPPSEPHMALDTPVGGASLARPVAFAGWAIDRAAGSGPGVDMVHVWAYPIIGNSLGSPVFLGTDYGSSRPDIAAAFGDSRFTNSGYQIVASGLTPGSYRIVVLAHSTVTGTFNNERQVDVTVGLATDPLMALDGPSAGATVSQRVTIAGWAIDRAAGSGPGVDMVHVWAYPIIGGSLGSPTFLGTHYGSSRPDIAAAFGDSRFTNSGYQIVASGLTPGSYRIVVYAHSTVTGTFNNQRQVDVTVGLATEPYMALDGPSAGATVSQPVLVAGWAIDRAAETGTGVDTVHVWAYPIIGDSLGSPTFLGSHYGSSRPDIAAAFGDSRFTNSGYQIVASGLSAGSYRIVVYARSTVTGTFNSQRQVDVTVTGGTP